MAAAENSNNRVFINGATIPGLMAASRLAKFKYQVTVKGETFTNTRIENYDFDTGHLFTLPAVYRDFFQKTGRHFGQILQVNPIDPAFVFRFPDLRIDFANSSHPARILELRSKLDVAAAAEWDSFIKQGEYFWEALRENYLELEFDYSRANLPIYFKLRAPWINNPYLRKIIGHYATYFGYPAGIYKWSPLVAFAESTFGIWQIKGGEGALHEALKARAIELGVNFGTSTEYDYFIDASTSHSRPTQRLFGVNNYHQRIPGRTVIFHEDGLTSDIYARELSANRYSLIVSGKLEINDFDGYTEVDQLQPEFKGTADNQLITKIRTANRRNFRVRHLDSLTHAAISGELLANAVRGIKNRPNHEH